MWRVVFICKGKNLEPAMRALVGLADSMDVPQPVANAVVTKGGQVHARVAGATLTDQLKNILLNRKDKQITTVELKTIVGELGYVPASYAKITHDLYKAKFLKRLDKGVYQVNN